MSHKNQKTSKNSKTSHNKCNPLREMLRRNEEGGILQEDYEMILYHILYHAESHRLSRPEAFEKIEELLGDVFSNYDWEQPSSRKIPRWMHHTDWARKKMVNREHVISKPVGIWNLTPPGLVYAEGILRRYG